MAALSTVTIIRYDQMAAAPAASSSISAPLELSQTQPLNATQVARQSGKCKVSRGEDIDGDGGGEGHQDKDTVGFEGDEWEEGEVERGMLHAFVELGHLEMLLHQARGGGARGMCWVAGTTRLRIT